MKEIFKGLIVVFIFYGLIHDILGDAIANTALAIFVIYSYTAAKKTITSRKENFSKVGLYESDEEIREKKVEDMFVGKNTFRFRIYTRISKINELIDQDTGNLIETKWSLCYVDCEISVIKDKVKNVEVSISPMLEKITDHNYPAALTFTRELETVFKYVNSDDILKNNFDFSTMPNNQWEKFLVYDHQTDKYIEVGNDSEEE